MTVNVQPNSARRAWRRIFFAATALALLGSLNACGGGSSDTGGTTPPTVTPPPPPAPLTAPAISVQPIDQTVVESASASFSVTATGDSLSYRWQASPDGGATWVDIAGATNPNYAFASTNSGMNGLRLRTVVSNSAGTATSSTVIVTVRRSGAPAATLALLAGGIGGAGDMDGAGIYARFRAPVGISIDGGGALHVWDAYGLGSLSGARVRRISALGFSQTLNLPFDPFFVGSGGPEVAPAADANGNLYFNGGEGTIRKLTGAGMITTVAGTPGTSGSADGTGSAASFSKGGAVAVDSAGNVYVADQWNSTIRKVTPAGVVTTIAGSPGVRGSSDGVGLAAFFNYPFGIAVDAAGNVFVADQWNHTIRRITPSGVVTTLAGVAGQPGGADGVGSAARFAAPSGLTIDAAGNLYVADRDNAAIRKITPAGVVVTVAGAAGQTGYADGSGNAARFDTPLGVTVDAAGNLFVADAGNSTIRRITPAGMVSTWAGAAPSAGSADGTGATANFRDPLGVAVASNGNVFIADWGNHTIRQITSAGVVTTLAGFALSPGSTDATGPAARFRNPGDIAVDSAGNLLVADAGNGLVRTVTTSGRVTTRLAREGAASVAVAPGGGFFLERILRTPANFLAMAFLPYSVFERIDAAGNANLLAGGLILPPNFAYRDGAGDQALIVAVGGVDYGRGNPSGVGLTSDAAGNLYFADSRNCAIRRIAPDGFVSTLAGGPPPLASCGNSDGIGTVARFDGPEGVALDGSGNIYVADTGNHTIRKIAPDGTVTTVLGVAGQSGIVLGASPGLSSPRRIAWLGGNRFLITSGNALLIATLP